MACKATGACAGAASCQEILVTGLSGTLAQRLAAEPPA
jgi:hypothetical protein